MLTQINVAIWHHQLQLEQLECLRSEDIPPPPHDYPYYWVILDPKSKEHKVTNLKYLPKLQTFEFWNKLYRWHTFWSFLIRCANMKWIRRVLLKIQSGHNSVHRRTDGRMDGQGETSIPPFQLLWSGGYNESNPPSFPHSDLSLGHLITQFLRQLIIPPGYGLIHFFL